MNTITLKVSSMSCGACARHVTEALESLAGVDTVAVDLKAGVVRILGTADDSTLIAVLDEAGYPAEPITDRATMPGKTGCGGSAGCCCR